MDITNDWLTVYYTDDGPFVYGPFPSEVEARQHIIDFFGSEYGLSPDEASERYETTGDDWVTRLLPVS